MFRRPLARCLQTFAQQAARVIQIPPNSPQIIHEQNLLLKRLSQELTGDNLDQAFNVHRRALDDGRVSPQVGTRLILASIASGEPEKGLETWVRMLEALGQRAKVNNVTVRPDWEAARVAVLAAYITSCNKSKMPVDASVASKLVQGSAFPAGLSSLANFPTLNPETRKLLKDGFRKLRQQSTDLGSRNHILSILGASFDEVQALYGDLTDRKNIPESVWSAFIRRFAETRQVERAFETWNTMMDSGISPTAQSWAELLRAGSLAPRHSAEIVDQLWEKMRSQGVEPNSTCFAVMIMSRFRARDITGAYAFWDQLKATGKVDTFSTNVMVSGLVDANKDPTKVLEDSPAKRDIVTYNTLLRASVAANNAPGALQLIDEMRNNHIEPDITTYGFVLDTLLREAEKGHKSATNVIGALLQEVKAKKLRPSAQFYTIITRGITRLVGNIDLTRRIYAEMVQAGVKPAVETLGALVSAELRHGSFDMALGFFDQISRRGLTPSPAIYNQVIDGALKHDRADDALVLLKRMGENNRTSPNKYTYMFILRCFTDKHVAAAGPYLKLLNAAISGLADNPQLLDYPLAVRVQKIADALEIVPSGLVEAAKLAEAKGRRRGGGKNL